MVVNATFNNISAISWQSVLLDQWRKIQTYHKSLTNFITKSCIECTSRFELTTLVVICT